MLVVEYIYQSAGNDIDLVVVVYHGIVYLFNCVCAEIQETGDL